MTTFDYGDYLPSTVFCDNCDAELSAIWGYQELRGSGWLIVKGEGFNEWDHYCPKCKPLYLASRNAVIADTFKPVASNPALIHTIEGIE